MSSCVIRAEDFFVAVAPYKFVGDTLASPMPKMLVERWQACMHFFENCECIVELIVLSPSTPRAAEVIVKLSYM